MKVYTILFVLSISLFVVLALPQNRYSSRFDNFDIDSVLSNERILKNYVKCMLDKGPCTSEGKEFKSILPEVLRTSCAKCTPPQRKNVKKITGHIMMNKPDEWNELMAKYDKNGEFKDNLREFLESPN